MIKISMIMAKIIGVLSYQMVRVVKKDFRKLQSHTTYRYSLKFWPIVSAYLSIRLSSRSKFKTTKLLTN